MSLSSKIKLQQEVTTCQLKISNAVVHIQFWEQLGDPEMVKYVRDLFKYDMLQKIYNEKKTELEKLKK